MENEELDLCKLLKGQEGKEFWSPMMGKCLLVLIDEKSNHPILCKQALADYRVSFTKEGKYSIDMPEGELLLFPSKEQRDWSKYNPCPFKDGELVWVKQKRDIVWNVRYHSGKLNFNTTHLCYHSQSKSGETKEWQECIQFDQRPSLS